MIGLFNADMDRRLFDLSTAIDDGHEIEVEFRAAFQHLPDRVMVTIAEMGRQLVFDGAMATRVADQLEINGAADVAQKLRSAFGNDDV